MGIEGRAVCVQDLVRWDTSHVTRQQSAIQRRSGCVSSAKEKKMYIKKNNHAVHRRHSYIGFMLAFASSIHNKQTNRPMDQSLNDTAADKVRKYRADYNMNPPNTVSFMSVIASTSGRLHSEFVRLLFLQSHRETDHFFTVSGVLSA
jgi:hypothetical protein